MSTTIQDPVLRHYEPSLSIEGHLTLGMTQVITLNMTDVRSWRLTRFRLQRPYSCLRRPRGTEVSRPGPGATTVPGKVPHVLPPARLRVENGPPPTFSVTAILYPVTTVTDGRGNSSSPSSIPVHLGPLHTYPGSCQVRNTKSVRGWGKRTL